MTQTIWEKNGSLAQAFWQNGRADIPVYDMHGHMGPHYAIYFKRAEAPEMVAHLRRIGVKKLVFSHHQALFGTMRNEKVIDICKQFPDILRMYVAINPHYPENIREDLAHFDEWRPYAFGLKFLADYHKVPVNNKAYQYALDFAEERGLPCLFHTWGRSQFNGGNVMLDIVHKYHNAKLFMGHSIFGEWDASKRCVEESTGNVWMELTAIPGGRGLIEKLVEDVGSPRILFGTDMPWFDEYQAVGGVLSARISEDDMRNILYRNAEKLMVE